MTAGGYVCRDLVDDLDGWLDGSLPPARQEAARRHLDGCRACRDYLDTYRRSRDLVERESARGDDALPDDLLARILERSRER